MGEPCPVCGGVLIEGDNGTPALLAVCDVLVIKALEAMGKWIVRMDRARFAQLTECGLPWQAAHTRWTVPDQVVTKALRGAWDVVPAMLDVHGCCGATSTAISQMLDSYVHDLVITGTAHTFAELHYRYEMTLLTEAMTGA